MKHFIFLILFFVSLGWATAAEPIKLNLEVGRTYTIETITHIDTSAQNPLRFWIEQRWLLTPLSFNKATQTYRMQAMLDYFFNVSQQKNSNDGWHENNLYETNYMSFYRSAMVYLNANKVPVFFDLTTLGKVDAFDFSEYNKTTDPEGFSLNLAPDDQKNIEAHIGSLFSERGSITWPAEETIDLQEYNSVIDTVTGLSMRRLYTFNYYKQEWVNGKARFDKNIINHAVSFHKYIPEYSFEKRSVRKFHYGIWSDTLISVGNTVIKGVINNRIAGQDSVDIITNKYETECFRVPLNNKNEFKVGFSLDQATVVIIRYPKLLWGIGDRQFKINQQKSSFIFDVAAGDNLKLELAVTDTALNWVSAYGVFTALFDVDQENSKLVKTMIINYGWLRDDKSFYSPLLTAYRMRADPRIYLDKLFQFNYSPRLRDGKSILPTKHEVVINNSLAKNNPVYMSFLKRYIDDVLENQLQSFTGVKSYSKTLGKQIEERYYLGHVAFAEPVKSHFLANFADETKRTLSRYNLYSSFSNNYDGSLLNRYRDRFYQSLYRYSSSIASDFTLKDIYGKKYSLSDFKKKVVVLHFHLEPWNDLLDWSKVHARLILRLEEIRYNTNNDLVYIFLLNRNNKELIKEIKSKSYKGIFLLADDENSTYPSRVSFDYLLPFRDSEVLLDKNGRIVEKWDYNISPKSIEAALSRPYDNSGNKELIYRIATLVVSIILVVVALVFFTYRVVSKQRLKRSELNKRMRELELTAIRAQMNPHFMYNCLNSIQNLVQKNKNDEAHLYLSKFASLIRRTLGTSQKEEVSLSEELETIKEYIGLEKLRFDFDVQFVIDEHVDLVSIFVPPMLLHPFVENALLHGLLPKPNNRILKIEISKEVDKICMVIEDNGVGRNLALENGSSGTGRGLELSKERLNLLSDKYQTSFDMTIEDATSPQNQYPGTRVTLCFNDEK